MDERIESRDAQEMGFEESQEELSPEIVEIRLDESKDAVQLAKGGGCSWK